MTKIENQNRENEPANGQFNSDATGFKIIKGIKALLRDRVSFFDITTNI